MLAEAVQSREVESTRPAPTREQILRLQDAMAAQPQVPLPPEHTFGPGFYVRTIRIPAGVALVGAIHKTEHLFILSKGILEVATEDGVARLEAPYQAVARAGLKRAGYAITDVVCSNLHITAETDLEKLEAELIEPEHVVITGQQISEVLE
jgi:hypothetical protein